MRRTAPPAAVPYGVNAANGASCGRHPSFNGFAGDVGGLGLPSAGSERAGSETRERREENWLAGRRGRPVFALTRQNLIASGSEVALAVGQAPSEKAYTGSKFAGDSSRPLSTPDLGWHLLGEPGGKDRLAVIAAWQAAASLFSTISMPMNLLVNVM